MAKPSPSPLPLTRADLADLEAGDRCCSRAPSTPCAMPATSARYNASRIPAAFLPDLEGATLFYAGPTPPAAAGRAPLGSVGPTTASRMDFATPALFKAGIVVAAIGKGKQPRRS